MEQQINNENNAGNDTANTNKTKQTNREYKSRLFSYIFGREETKDRTLSLYNSLNGTNYTNPDDITLTTIEDVIYMGMKNDLSYIVSDRASLYSAININEHQSTGNPNMPLREFMYAAKLYDKYLKMKKKNPYSSTIIPLPIPKLVVLYNGKTDVPDELIMRLSDAFREEIRQNLIMRQQNDDTNSEGAVVEINEEEVEAILKKASPDIEVTVRMVNINYGHSKEILTACESLNEYSWLVDQIRINVDTGMELEEAVNKALDDMPDDYELKEQLLAHRAEVIGMWINEYNEEETMQMFKEEGKQEGIILGEQRGRQEEANLFSALIKKLTSLGKSEDIIKIADDSTFREKLYVQYGLKKTM